ncbi:MAG: sigma-70 family RNA polymerase sigma factor [Dehalococcoidia bacterium]
MTTVDHEPQRDAASDEDVRVLAALRAGDETAFMLLVEQYQGQLIRVAMMYVSTRDVAEEVVQETWLGVLKGLDRFEGRSSLKTWMFRILTNIAKTRGVRESRTIPFSALVADEAGGEDLAVDPSRFQASGESEGAWLLPPAHWDELPESALSSSETLEMVRGAIDQLPPAQRQVIQLRDIDGWSAEEVCNVLELTETNQRVLLHRARSKVRRAIERYLDG